MNKIKIFLFLFCFYSLTIFSQVETVPADHQVYSFLKDMYVKGAIKEYNDVILPLSKSAVCNYLSKVEKHSNLLSSSEREFLCRMEVKMGMKNKETVSFLSDSPSGFLNNIKSYREKHFYSYDDSTARLNFDLIGDFTYLYSDDIKDYSVLLNIGGEFVGSYSDWLGFMIEGMNGTQLGNRQVAELDPRVRSSFTFKHTGINYFDHTQGYIIFRKKPVSLELGRERILWGNGVINRMILSENPPSFDFLKFNIRYKSLNYDFIHGWLVRPTTDLLLDTLTGYVREKGSKYLAISRLGFNATSNIKLGISQMIIYADRPFEAAYLNPFLFWESAQRSLGDLDNSFLSYDMNIKLTDGLETSFLLLLDDIKYSVLFKGEFDKVDNRSAYQIGTIMTDPLLPSNFTFKLEYLAIRPYTFSHPSLNESLIYTNNSYMLGIDLQPNSTALSAELDYLLAGRWKFELKYSHVLHGNNLYDDQGKLVRNVGGNIYENLNGYASLTAPLLDGELETRDIISLNIRNEIIYGLYWNTTFRSTLVNFMDENNTVLTFLTQLQLYFR